jgi:serine/threonine-protein kinase
MSEKTQRLNNSETTVRIAGRRRLGRTNSSARIVLPEPGYELGNRIGEGGMGEVIAAYDERIGREVAIKRMRNSRPSMDALARFVREAQIQGRLDHPAIVPMYELATDESDRPYFTMKRISGQTLDRRAAESAPLHQLLRAFAGVCRAIEFAHSRGVVHRDLKPANVMLGDYGEVYVLDWGIARLIDERHSARGMGPCGDGDHTRTGTLMGTLGYIAPELYRGALATPATDVYALGVILFELLAGERLHKQVPTDETSALVLREHPSRRRPDRAIPPELDEVCFQALSPEPDARPTAHELAERVQAYLDGDRDLDRRRVLAEDHLRSANEALSSGSADARILALRRASRALALDPESQPAAGLVSALLIASPDPIPPALVARLESQDREDHRDRSRKAIYVYLALLLLLPLLFMVEVKNLRAAFALLATIGAAMAGSAFHLWRGRPSIAVVGLTSVAVAVAFSRIASPFVLTPPLVTCALVAITTIPWFAERTWAVIAWTAASVLTPFALEWTGVLSPTWLIMEHGIMITGDVFVARGPAGALVLVFANLVCATIGGLMALGMSRRQRHAQRQLSIRAWHLGHLVPAEAHPS